MCFCVSLYVCACVSLYVCVCVRANEHRTPPSQQTTESRFTSFESAADSPATALRLLTLPPSLFLLHTDTPAMPPLDPKVIQVYAKYVFPLRAGPISAPTSCRPPTPPRPSPAP